MVDDMDVPVIALRPVRTPGSRRRSSWSVQRIDTLEVLVVGSRSIFEIEDQPVVDLGDPLHRIPSTGAIVKTPITTGDDIPLRTLQLLAELKEVGATVRGTFSVEFYTNGGKG